MARRRKRRPTLAQCLVGVATAGMPPPVRSVLGSRLGSLVVMIALPILVITGVVSIQWNSGLPQVSIDRQRAKEIEAKAVDSLQKLREQENGLLTLRPVAPPPHALFLVHYLLVALLMIYFPFSKLLHAGGIFFSPTRNQPYTIQKVPTAKGANGKV